jgi:hypothetical protein
MKETKVLSQWTIESKIMMKIINCLTYGIFIFTSYTDKMMNVE